jgi:hypothetical protein
MAGQTVESDHPDPIVDGIELSVGAAIDEVFLEGADLAESVGVIEDEELFWELVVSIERDLVESLDDLLECGGTETRAREIAAEGIDVATPWDTVEERGFDESCAAAHEGVVNDVAGVGQALDEEARELRFKTGAIGDFVEVMGLSLLGGPELVDEDGEGEWLIVRAAGAEIELSGAGAELVEGCQLIWQRGMGDGESVWLGWRWGARGGAGGKGCGEMEFEVVGPVHAGWD